MSFKHKAAGVFAAAALAGTALVGLAGSASADPNASYIGSGYSTNSHAVWCVQHNLNYWMNQGPYVKSPAPYGNIAEDGSWGPQTEATVKWFQAQFNDSTDGVVGPMTGTQLLSNGDHYYNGTSNSAPGYCYWYIPGTIIS